MKEIINKVFFFAASLRTGIWLFFALIAMLFYGSFIMPVREEFQALHTTPLFEWLAEAPAAVTWWLIAAIVVLSGLTANTMLCSIESLFKKRSAKNLLLTISPQVMHIGFLFILLAHLLSSYDSYQGITQAVRGSSIDLPNGDTAVIDDIRADIDPRGYINDWSANVHYIRHGREIGRDSMGPNSPSFSNGIGLYLKTVRFEPFPVALIQISRDPGSVWALIGGVLFLVGMMTLLVLKIRREETV